MRCFQCWGEVDTASRKKLGKDIGYCSDECETKAKASVGAISRKQLEEEWMKRIREGVPKEGEDDQQGAMEEV